MRAVESAAVVHELFWNGMQSRPCGEIVLVYPLEESSCPHSNAALIKLWPVISCVSQDM